jgi:serine/threonine protein kinase
VRVDDLGDVGDRHVAIPDLLGINDDRHAVLALIEAPGVVRTNLLADAARLELLLELVANLRPAFRHAATLRVVGGTLVDAHKDVALELRHFGASVAFRGILNETMTLVGQVLGSYRITEELSSGGVGTVYRAHHELLGRPAAVKILRASAAPHDAIGRFFTEARAASAIRHPGIVEVLDFGYAEDGVAFLVMELLEGETLVDRATRLGGRLPREEVVAIAQRLLGVLVAAHAAGVVHRDIKPENVFLTQRVGFAPIAKLLDFGVSKILPAAQGTRDSDLDLTRAGMVMGTPFYMSPEQARGDRDLDARVDIYGCGVLLYEALTGKKPFEAKSYNVLLWQIMTKSPKPVQQIRPEIPESVARVIEKAMSRAREDRYVSAASFISALVQARAEPGSAGTPRVPVAPPTERMTFDHDFPQSILPISVELPSENLVTSSSNAAQVPYPPVPSSSTGTRARARRGGFEDVPTEIERLRDFSLSDEGDAATTLMKDEDIAALANRTRESAVPEVTPAQGSRPSSPRRGAPEAVPYDEAGTAVMNRDDMLEKPAAPFNAEETVRMDRPDSIPKRRAPKPPR